MATTTGSEQKGKTRLQSTIPPGPRESPVIGGLIPMRRIGPLQYYETLWRQYGDVFQHRLMRMPIYLFIHPDDVEYILATNKDNFDKGTIIDVRAQRVLGQSLFTSVGKVWEDLRFLMDPPFSAEVVPEFYWTMTGATESLMERWKSVVAGGKTVDLVDEMMRFTFSTISRAIFSEDLSEEGAEARPGIIYLLQYVHELVLQPILLPAFVPTRSNRRYHDAMRQINALVKRHIETRRRQGEMKPDLISHFLQATDPHGRHMTDIQVRDQVLTTFVAGQENAALALAWFFYLIAGHPEIEERVHVELDQVLSGRVPAQDDIPKLVVTRRAYEEAIRLYPVLWVIPRIAQQDDVIGGYKVPAGTMVVINVHLTHRHPEFWENPEGFDPDRMTPERTASLPHYAYLPFGGGKRKCIGNKYALLASLQFIATVCQQYRIRPVPGHQVVPFAVSTIRPKYGMPVTLEER